MNYNYNIKQEYIETMTRWRQKCSNLMQSKDKRNKINSQEGDAQKAHPEVKEFSRMVN